MSALNWELWSAERQHEYMMNESNMAKSELSPARGSADFMYCKDCIHSCAQMQVPTYHPDAWCYMFRESQRESINTQGYCGQKRLNPIVPPIPPND